MTYRVKENYFLKVLVRNIAISGGSPLTGLAIVGSYSSIPRLAMVEMNIMARPTESGLIEQIWEKRCRAVSMVSAVSGDYFPHLLLGIKPLVEDLEGRGRRIVYFELPYPGQLGDYHYAVLTRSLMQAAFPDPKYWPDLDFHRSELRWTDSAHMDERSAIIVAKEIERYIASSPAAF